MSHLRCAPLALTLLVTALAGCELKVSGLTGQLPSPSPGPSGIRASVGVAETPKPPTRTPEAKTSEAPRPGHTPGPNDPPPTPKPSSVPIAGSPLPSMAPTSNPNDPPATPRPSAAPRVAIGIAQPVDLQLPPGFYLDRPQGLAFDAQGLLYINEASGAEGHVFRAGPDGRAELIAGGKEWPYDESLAERNPADLMLFAANTVAALPGGEVLVSSGGTANTLYAFTPGKAGVKKRFTHQTDSLEQVVVTADGQAYGLVNLARMSNSAVPMPGRATSGFRVVAIDDKPGGTTVVDQLEVNFGRFALGAGPDGALWIAGNRELRRWAPDGTQAVVATDEVFANPDYGLAVAADGTLYGATQWGVFRYDVAAKKMTWLVDRGFDSFPHIALAPNGDLWISSVQPAGLYRIPAEKLKL